MRLNKAFHIITVSLGLFPILKLNHFSLLMMVWFCLAIITAIKNKTFKINKTQILVFVILSFCSLMYFFSLPFAIDFKELFKQIVKSLPFLIFPIGFLINRRLINKSVVSLTLKTFAIVTVLLNAYGWFKILKYGFLNAWNENNFYQPVYRTIFSEATNLHLPYLGLFSAFTGAILMYNQLKIKRVQLYSVIVLLFLGGSMYVYSARMGLLCLILTSVFLVVKQIKSVVLKALSVVLIPCFLFLFLWISPLKERYISAFETEMILPHKEQMPHEVNYRYGIWYCALQNIKEHPLFGVNPDQAQDRLNECYTKFDYESYEDFTKVTYNTHNQYLDQFLKFGVLGFLLFVCTFGFFLKNSSSFYQLFILLIGLSFLTENFLDRQMGVVFVALFNSLFVVYNLNKREESYSS